MKPTTCTTREETITVHGVAPTWNSFCRPCRLIMQDINNRYPEYTTRGDIAAMAVGKVSKLCEYMLYNYCCVKICCTITVVYLERDFSPCRKDLLLYLAFMQCMDNNGINEWKTRSIRPELSDYGPF